jgi:hypothetical protein
MVNGYNIFYYLKYFSEFEFLPLKKIKCRTGWCYVWINNHIYNFFLTVLGAFLLPYCLTLVISGIPMFFLESKNILVF